MSKIHKTTKTRHLNAFKCNKKKNQQQQRMIQDISNLHHLQWKIWISHEHKRTWNILFLTPGVLFDSFYFILSFKFLVTLIKIFILLSAQIELDLFTFSHGSFIHISNIICFNSIQSMWCYYPKKAMKWNFFLFNLIVNIRNFM